MAEPTNGDHVDHAKTSALPLTLTEEDQRHLAELERRFQLVRDYTASVATYRTTGFYLYGKGGTSKSYQVTQELERLGTPYKLLNSRLTGRGLFDRLEAFPDEIHLLEDMEQLFHDKAAMGVLRSALWGMPPIAGKVRNERPVTWTTNRMEHSFVFTGGIIMTGNRPFPPIPEMDAIRTRIQCTPLLVNDNELTALMRKVSLKGFAEGMETMDAAECLAVCELIVSQCRSLQRSLDMRMLINSFRDYLQWRECQSGCDWRDLVRTRINERPIGLEEVRTSAERAVQKDEELAIAREISMKTASCAEKIEEWIARTGKSQQTYYRRVKQFPRFDTSVRTSRN